MLLEQAWKRAKELLAEHDMSLPTQLGLENQRQQAANMSNWSLGRKLARWVGAVGARANGVWVSSDRVITVD